MAVSQDVTGDGDQGDTENSEVKNLPDKESESTKVINAQILAGGYTKGLCRSHFALVNVIL